MRVTGEGGGNRSQFLALPEASLGSLLVHIEFNSTGPWILFETNISYADERNSCSNNIPYFSAGAGCFVLIPSFTTSCASRFYFITKGKKGDYFGKCKHQ